MISDFMSEEDYEQTLKIASKNMNYRYSSIWYTWRKDANIGMVSMLDAETRWNSWLIPVHFDSTMKNIIEESELF
jgi:hypothetical protein